jgi:nitrogen fixation protein FixH
MTAARRGFTGRHMAVILISFFAVVIAVNVYMARMAIGTFGGVVVENSYVASQHFNHWLDEAKAEGALGWQADIARGPGGRLVVMLHGVPAGAVVSAVLRHPLGRLPDRGLAFAPGTAGQFISSQPIADGRWLVRLEVQAQGHLWRQETNLP